LDNTPIGVTTPSTAAFTTLSTTGAVNLGSTLNVTGSIQAGGINNTPIGATTPSTAAFTTISTSGGVNIGSTLNVTGLTNANGGLNVPDGNYAQLADNNAGAPAAADCDADNERGRISIDTTNNRLYVCNGATRGWDYIALTN
jgi:hypothetical protein